MSSAGVLSRKWARTFTGKQGWAEGHPACIIPRIDVAKIFWLGRFSLKFQRCLVQMANQNDPPKKKKNPCNSFFKTNQRESWCWNPYKLFGDVNNQKWDAARVTASQKLPKIVFIRYRESHFDPSANWSPLKSQESSTTLSLTDAAESKSGLSAPLERCTLKLVCFSGSHKWRR